MTDDPSQRRLLLITGLAIGVGLAAGGTAAFLIAMINLITHLAFDGAVSLAPANPEVFVGGIRILLVPVAGALFIGILARWGSEAIRGHGIPEVIDRILHADSRIPAKLTVLKPLSAAIAIGTGGPFGAEGPIIATGGAIGSLLGQVMHVTADERKVLLAAGAAAGMAATFGTPVAAVLLAVELLLFEYRARSIMPVALAACAATAVRLVLLGTAPVFPMPNVTEPTGAALVCYALLGGVVGFIAVGISRALYRVEDLYERLPIHWMWWPLIGATVVGLLGLLEPRILGIGIYNILDALAGRLAIGTLLVLITLKFIAWVGYLGSGTSGGTLAPLFTFGSGLGAIAGALLAAHFPGLGISPPVAALVGMAAMFAGASRALLTSVVFAFETTRQPLGLLPLLAGCTSAALISRIFNRHTIMTEKLARRGVVVPDEYATDYLSLVHVEQAMSSPVVTVDGERLAGELLATLDSVDGSHHQGFPVVDATGELLGLLTRRDLVGVTPNATLRSLVRRAPVTALPSQSLRDAADIMVREGIGRLAIVDPAATDRVIGIVTRSDLLQAHAPRIQAAEQRETTMPLDHLTRSIFGR
ncbi:MAG: chloride channel protein [Gemmatimonadota bacterium]